jgi:hypothetical protein
MKRRQHLGSEAPRVIFSIENSVRTSVSSMRSAVAIGMAMLLFSILALCPVMACPLTPATKSCCHKAQTEFPSYPPTIQACPYLLLDKGQTVTASVILATIALPPVSPNRTVVRASAISGNEIRLPDSSGLYLRLRVLLI